MPKRVSKDYINDVENFNELPIYSQRIRYYLDEHSLTAKDLNEKAGFSSPNVVPSLIKGSRELSLDAAKKLCTVMSVSIDYLVGRSNAATANAEVSSICAYTGLSAQAVNSLHSTTTQENRLSVCFQNEITSQLIESGYFKSLCTSIKRYFLEAALAEKTIADALNDLIPKSNVYEAEKRVKYAQFDVTETIKYILDETAKVPNIYAFELQYQVAHAAEGQNGEHNETDK